MIEHFELYSYHLLSTHSFINSLNAAGKDFYNHAPQLCAIIVQLAPGFSDLSHFCWSGTVGSTDDENVAKARHCFPQISFCVSDFWSTSSQVVNQMSLMSMISGIPLPKLPTRCDSMSAISAVAFLKLFARCLSKSAIPAMSFSKTGHLPFLDLLRAAFWTHCHRRSFSSFTWSYLSLLSRISFTSTGLYYGLHASCYLVCIR